MYIVDSSVWVALFLTKDSQHEKATAVIEEITPPVYVSRDVVAEVCTVLTNKHSKELGNKFAQFLQRNEDIIILSDSPKELLGFFITVEADISFQDAGIIRLAQVYDLDILSFDEQLMEVASGS
jgi:predicted nucleic acid-binding protein